MQITILPLSLNLICKVTNLLYDPLTNLQIPYRLLIKFMCYVLGQDHERAFFDSADWALGKVL